MKGLVDTGFNIAKWWCTEKPEGEKDAKKDVEGDKTESLADEASIKDEEESISKEVKVDEA